MSVSIDKVVMRRLFCLFVCASLYFLTVDVLADVRVLELLGDAAVIPIHLMYLLFQCAGFLLFSVLDGFFRGRTSGRWPVIALLVLSAISLMVFLLVSNATIVVAAIDLCLLTSGMIGAFSYYRIAVGMQGSDSLGQFCGFAIASAAILQMLVIALPLPGLGRAGLLLLSLCVVAVCVLTDVSTNVSTIASADASAPMPTAVLAAIPTPAAKPRTRYLVILIAIVAVISFVGGMNDGVLTRMNAESQIDLYALPRFFYLAAAIAAGFIADYRDGRYLGIILMAAMLCSTVGLLFMDDPVTIFTNACIYSFLAGLSIMFFTVPFMRLAVRTDRPTLWASMGRTVRLPFLALGTLTMEFALGGLPFGVTVGLSAILCAVLFILFFAGGFLSVSEPAPATVDAPATVGVADDGGTDYEVMAQFGQAHGLTSREREILVLLYQGCTTTEVADKLFISEKTVRNHISNMMTKTDVSSRTELLMHALKPERS